MNLQSFLQPINPFSWLQTTKAQLLFYAPTSSNKLLATFILKEETISIGRVTELPVKEEILVVKERANIMIANQPASSKISRQHATLSWDAGFRKYKFEEHSKYGSKINSKYIHHDDNIILNNKDIIDIQGLRFQILYS